MRQLLLIGNTHDPSRILVTGSSGLIGSEIVRAYAQRGTILDGFDLASMEALEVVQAADGSSTHISRDGSLLHEQWFDDLDVFHRRFARARDAGGWMHVDMRGRPIYTRRFATVEPFYNGQARVERFDHGLEIISETGVTILELRPTKQPRRASTRASERLQA